MSRTSLLTLSALSMLGVLAGPTSAPSVARADALGTSRIGLIDSERLWTPAGIAPWAAARAKLDAEQSTFVALEAPDGKSAPETITLPTGPYGDPRLRERVEELNRGIVQRAAWRAHEEAMLEPIMADVQRALERYAKLRGLGLVLDRAKLGAGVLLVANPGIDVTDAFIKDYNARTRPRPATPAAGRTGPDQK